MGRNKKSEKKPPIHYNPDNPLPGNTLRTKPEYLAFVEWFATPRAIREKLNLPLTQKAFADKIGYVEDTISLWKQMPEFKTDVIKSIKDFGFSKIPGVVNAWLERLQFDSTPGDIKLMLQWLADFAETMKVEGGASEEVKDLLRQIHSGGIKGTDRKGPKVVPKRFS